MYLSGIIAHHEISFTFILIGLLVAGCHRREAKLTHQIAGAWNHVGGGFSMTISSDGSFSSGSSNVAYQGTWLVRDAVLVVTITNATGTKQHEPVGSVDRMKIVQADEGHLTLESSGQTTYYERR
jgi:hypothetical protein